MKPTIRLFSSALLALSLACILTSCEKGPAEKAGQKVDEAVQDTKDAAHRLKDDIKKHN